MAKATTTIINTLGGCVAEPFPIVAVTPVGTPGFPAGLTAEEEGEVELLPVALLATAENE